MAKHFLLLTALFLPAIAPARDKPENWVEVRSPHFSVVTSSNEKTGRRIADQFERMRSVFHELFPKLEVDDAAPIIVLAIKDEKDFRALEPQAYLAKGQLKLGGLFLRAPDKNYVLMRVDAEGQHPYSVVYHEYTHYLLRKSDEWMPLWLNEGLAELYQNTEIHEKEVLLGEPSTEDLMWLRQNRLLPLATLFTVDTSSPLYHEENKGSIFYSESWALTHYIFMRDFADKGQRLTTYTQLLGQKVEPLTAATQAFGDLKQLQSALEGYIRQGSYQYFKKVARTEVDDSAFKVQSLPPATADAIRADFLAYNDRTADSRALLDRILHEDPNNAAARETMGFLEFRQGHIDEARKWYAQAVKLDSQSYLAHYYFAAISMNSPASEDEDSQVESSLRAAIKLNPSFAPAFERLAAFEAMRHRNLDDARIQGLTAIQLDPSNVNYRISYANVFLMMEQPGDAISVLRNALHIAKKPEELDLIQNLLSRAQAYAQMKQRADEQNAAWKAQSEAQESAPREEEGTLAAPQEVATKGPHRFLIGKLKDVHCKSAVLDLSVVGEAKTLSLHSGNYYKIQFTSLGFNPRGDLKPCTELEGRPAKVEYVESLGDSGTGQVLAIELHK